MSRHPALVLEHQPDAPAALLADWAQERGIALDIVRPADFAGATAVQDRPFLVSLGSKESAYDDTVAWLAAERALLDGALRAGVPILGICFGSQHLARALGGVAAPVRGPRSAGMRSSRWRPSSSPPARGCSGTPTPSRCRRAPSSWPGLRWVRRPSRRAVHLGVQFHPEVTPAVVDAWCAKGAEEARRAARMPATSAPPRKATRPSRAGMPLHSWTVSWRPRGGAAAARSRMRARAPG